MSTNPFRAPGEWLKAALHTHSTESDGTLPPARLVTTYEEAGFDVVAITDHWRLTEVPSTDRVLTVRGAELGWDLARPNYATQSGMPSEQHAAYYAARAAGGRSPDVRSRRARSG